MPGPARKTKNKPRKSSANGPSSNLPTVSSLSDAAAIEIDGIQGWTAVVEFLCEHFKLPDLTRRSGLKKIHTQFGEVHRKLNNAYASHPGNEKIMGGVVAIWAKMCVDGVLRNMLIREGIVDKIMPLMDTASTRVVGLEALATITHHGGLNVHVEIAKRTPTLLRLMEEFPDNPRINELAVTTICHAAGSAIGADPCDYDEHFVKTLDVPCILKCVTDAMRKPTTASIVLVAHGMGLVASTCRHVPKHIKDLPPLVALMAATLRVNDMSARSTAVVAFIHITQAGSEEEIRNFDPKLLISALQRGFPAHLVDVMANVGPMNCETFVLSKTKVDFQKAMVKIAQDRDRDFITLGRSLAELITRTEFSVTEGVWQTKGKDGQMRIPDLGLPFQMWTDALPVCAKELRKAPGATSSDLDMADILDLKFLIIRARIPEAVEHAQKAINRNPRVAYFYYALGLSGDQAQALRAVKKGLLEKQTTPFLKYYMLWRAVVVAAHMGVELLSQSRAGDQEYSEGVAFLTSAFDDAEEFFKVAPPDARHTTTVVNWYIILTFATKGNEISEDLRELQPALKRLEIARQITEHIGFPYKKTNIRLAREMMMRMWPKALQDYASTITHYNSLYEKHSHGPRAEDSVAAAGDTLTAWLDNLHLEDGQEGPDTHCLHPKINSNSVELYRCTNCRNPSATLRKCSGCAKAKYCDADCQKAHWSKHKKVCKPAST